MINTVIIEDEFYSQEYLKKLLTENFPQIKIVGLADNVESAVKLIAQNKPQLVLFDVEIIGGTSFDVLQKLKSREFECVFVTAYSEHAISAIKAEAADYILKPINSTEFKFSIKKIIEKINYKSRIAEIEKVTKTRIPTGNGFVYVASSEVLYLKAEGAYTHIILSDRRLLSSTRIGELERVFDVRYFVRCHYSYVINVNKVTKFTHKRTGILTMENNEEIPVSQRRIKYIKEHNL